jgi:predicted dehydrogenase
VVEPESNAEVVVRSLEAGKHVICEVPLAYTLEDCWRIILAVERSGLTMAMAEQLSYAPFVPAWPQLIDDGLLGKIIYAEAQYLHGLPDEWYWTDARTGRRLSWAEAKTNPTAVKSRLWTLLHPIWYNPHSLGPLLRILDDRVTQVTCLSTRRQSYYREDVPLPDIEVALMHTERDTIVRLAAGLVAPSAEVHHWFHLLGTRGEVETDRRRADYRSLLGAGSLLWLADHYMRSRTEVDWSFTAYQPGTAPPLASGHGGLDHYPVYDFIHSILEDRAPLVDVYRAAEIAGPAIVAGQSAEQGAVPLPVPDFRPGPQRQVGQAPT